MKKNKFSFFVLWLIELLIIFVLTGCSQSTSFFDMEYRTDIQPITERFTIFTGIEQAYWKYKIIGNYSLGPSSYSLVGFIKLSEADIKNMTENYCFDKIVKLSFPDGISTSITGYTEFEWLKSATFTRDVLNSKFVGEIYFDNVNGLVYFNVQNT